MNTTHPEEDAKMLAFFAVLFGLLCLVLYVVKG